jgi:bifunctional DNase/RNase
MSCLERSVRSFWYPLGALLALVSSLISGDALSAEKMVAVQVQKVVLVNEQPAVLLANEQEHMYLLVYIDHFMAQSIQLGLMDVSIERPLTHDLIGILLRRMGAEVTRVSITELRDSTYFALISLRQNGSVQEIDARPSDALAIAVRLKTPIYAARNLLSDQLFPEGAPGQPTPEGPGTTKQGA